MNRVRYIPIISLGLLVLVHITACSNSRSSRSSNSDAATSGATDTNSGGTSDGSSSTNSCTPSLCTVSSSTADCAYFSCNRIDVTTSDGVPLGTCKEWVGANALSFIATSELENALISSCETDGGIFSYGPCPCDNLVASCHVLSIGADDETVDRFYTNFAGGGDNLAAALDVVLPLCSGESEWIE